jgi:hypothetical protein
MEDVQAEFQNNSLRYPRRKATTSDSRPQRYYDAAGAALALSYVQREE